MNRTVRTRRRMAVLAVLALGVAATGCGGSDADGAGAKVPKVQVSIAAPNGTFADLLAAQELGYFKRAGVDVDIQNKGTTGVTLAAAGKIDLALSGTPSAFAPSLQGHQTTVVYCWSRGYASAGVVVPADSPVHQLSDLAGKRVAVQGIGSSSYGTAKYFSRTLEQRGLAPLKIVAINNDAGITAQLVSGKVDGYVGTLSFTSREVSAGKARVIVDPGSGAVDKLFGQGGKQACGHAAWGLKTRLEKNRQGITRFLSGMRAGDAWLSQHSDADVAKLIAQSPVLTGYTPEQLEAELKFDRPFFSGANGATSSSQWQEMIDVFKSFDLPYDLDSAQVGYADAVDMSYLDQAPKLKVGGAS